MKVHAFVPMDDAVYTRETSCYHPCCWSEGVFHPICHGWTRQGETPIDTQIEEPQPVVEESDLGRVNVELEPSNTTEFAVEDFVAARYLGNTYIGKIL